MSRRSRPAARPPKRRPTRQGGRSASSIRWLRRQRNDPYVAEARRRGYRSRAAFKLLELDARFRLLRPQMRVLDLGAAPGGWSQVAAEARARVVAVDAAPMEPVPGVAVIQGDVREAAVERAVRAALGGPADAILSDMAPASTGHAATDHLRVVVLCEAAWALAERLLAPGGCFVAKVLQGGTEATLLAALRRRFATVRHAKPPASRAGSAEVYVVAKGFRG